MSTRLLYDFVLEYLLIGKLHLQSILMSKSSASWSKGNKGDVILIPGFNSTWVSLQTIADNLNKLGYRIHTIQEFNSNFLLIDKCVKILDKYIKDNDLKDVVLLSHSKGGIIAKRFMDTAKNGNKVRHSISIATPYNGTLFGHLRALSLKEFMPSNKVIKDVIGIKTNNHKIINLYAEFDNHIIPNKNAILSGARNIMVSVVGHTRILESQSTIQEINKLL